MKWLRWIWVGNGAKRRQESQRKYELWLKIARVKR